MKLFNEKIITIYTVIIYFVLMMLFELGYCNVNYIANGGEYNFSLCRIILYVVFLAIYFVFRKKFVGVALQISEKKSKRILVYISLVLALMAVIYVIVNSINIEQSEIRYTTVKIMIILVATIFVIYVSNDMPKNVIVMSCTFGIIFTFVTSFNHAIDEKKHFMSALNVSFLNLDYTSNPITDKKINELPQLSKFTTIDEFLKNNYEADITDEVDMEDSPSTPATYNVCVYIFPAIGITIARVLNGSIIDMYILGRLMNLILYTVLIYIAMKILPFKKNIFFIIAFMPYMLLLASTYSADGICLGTIFIFVAYCLKVYKECETISLKQILILLGLFAIMLIGKGIAYVLIAILAFMFPLVKTIKKNKKYIPYMILAGLVILIIGVLLLVYMKNTQINSDGDNRGSGGINAVEQLNLVLTNPVWDAKVMLEHIKVTLLCYGWYSNLYQSTFFTANSEYVFFVMMLFILFVSITEDDHNFNLKNKIILILAFLACFGVSSMILYLTFTPVGNLYIQGYQARYIFPILPLILSCISNKRLKYEKSENRIMNVCICNGIFVFIGLLQLITV